MRSSGDCVDLISSIRLNSSIKLETSSSRLILSPIFSFSIFPLSNSSSSSEHPQTPMQKINTTMRFIFQSSIWLPSKASSFATRTSLPLSCVCKLSDTSNAFFALFPEQSDDPRYASPRDKLPPAESPPSPQSPQSPPSRVPRPASRVPRPETRDRLPPTPVPSAPTNAVV